MPDTSANSGHFMIFQLLSHSSLKAFKKSKTYIQELKELRLCSVPHQSVSGDKTIPRILLGCNHPLSDSKRQRVSELERTV